MSRRFVYFVTGFAAIGGLLFGYDTGVISGALENGNFALLFYPLTATKKGLITSFLVLGCFLGALIAGYTCDFVGRKNSILVSSVIFTIGAMFQAFSNGLLSMSLGRLISGVSVGVLSMAVPLYQSELSEPSIRGRLVSLQILAITSGIAVSFWVNYICEQFLVGELTWRLPLGLQAVPSVILFVGCFFLPYSHRWLISKGNKEAGLVVLAKLRGGGDVNHPAVQEEYSELVRHLELEKSSDQSSYFGLFSPQFRRRLLLGISVQAFQQLSGINTILYYSPQIYKQAGFGLQAGLLATAINGLLNAACTIPALLFIDTWGRRKTLIGGAVLTTIGMSITGIMMGVFATSSIDSNTNETVFIINNIWASYSVIAFIFVFIIGYATSWGVIAWVYPAELFPMPIRSKAISITTASNWLFNYLISLLSPILMQQLNWGLYIILASFSIIMVLSVYFYYPETCGYSLEEIDANFNNNLTVHSPKPKRF